MSAIRWDRLGNELADRGFAKPTFGGEPHGHRPSKLRGHVAEVCFAIEMGADVVDIAKTIHPHPTLGESIGMAAEIAHGTCTDVPAARKK
jgi:dihydrolipoamide dehydrogenase